jgi:hypothetical protein
MPYLRLAAAFSKGHPYLRGVELQEYGGSIGYMFYQLLQPALLHSFLNKQKLWRSTLTCALPIGEILF